MKELWTQIKALTWDFFSGYGKEIALALVILAVGLLVIAIVKKAVKKNSTKSRKVDNSAAAFITSIVALVAYVILILAIIASLGFSTTSVIAAFSSVMLAVALGLQNTLASLANGILLIFTKPFVAGDYVDIGGTSGTVKEIKLFSVKLVTPDNLTIVIPNNTVFSSTIINYSKMPLRRLDIVVPVTYKADVEQVKTLINDILSKDARISRDPAPFCRLTEYGASSLNFTMRAWVNAGDYWAVRFDLLEGILAELRANNIEIPYQQLEVYLKKTEGGNKE